MKIHVRQQIRFAHRVTCRAVRRNWKRCFNGTMVTASVFAMLFQMWHGPELLAKEIHEQQVEAALVERARAERTYVDENLPAGRQHDRAIELLRDAVLATLEQLRHGEDPSERIKDIDTLCKKLRALKLKTMSRLTAVRTQLQSQNASKLALDRHEAFTDQLVKQHLEFERLVRLVQRYESNTDRLTQCLVDLHRFIRADIESAEQQKDHGEDRLPRHRSSASLRTMPRSAQSFPYFQQWPWRFAAAGDVITDLLSQVGTPSVTGQPTQADLDPTPDIELDGIVAAKAAELNNDPVQIFEFVRNELVYEPYFGSVKGAKRTLLEQAGNDIDIASATMALLRASNIPCRYVFGTIEMDVTEAAAWVGVDDPNQVAKVFTANSIPAEFDTSGGGVGTVRVDHVWVKAFVDHFPHRGAVQEQADTWIEIDGSFKQNTFTGSRDIEVQVGIDPNTFLTNIKANSTVDPDGDFAQDVPEPFILGELLMLAEPIRDYLVANDLTTETVFRQRIVAEERFGILPVTDQYKIVARGMNFSSLPNDLRSGIQIQLKNIDGSISLDLTTHLPDLAGKRITLSYTAATPGDAQIIADQADTADFPAYLVELRPELRVDGQIVASGSPVTMGHIQTLTTTFTDLEGDAEVITDRIAAGGYHALVLNYQQTNSDIVAAEQAALATTSATLSSADPSALDREAIIGQVLHGIGVSYFHQIDRFNLITAGSLGVATTRLPSMVRVAWDLSIDEQFGLPFAANANRVRIDVGRDVYVPVAITQDNTAGENQFMFTAALTSSAMEHNAIIQALNGEAASAVRALQAANADGAKTYTITSDNVDAITLLLEATLPTSVVNAVRDAVNAGREVTISEQPADLDGVSYIAQIQRDIDTSDSAFILEEVTASTGTANGAAARVTGGQQVNTALRAADLLAYNSAPEAVSRYLQPVSTTAEWLNVVEGSTTNAGLSYLPAITDINAWYANRTELDPVTTLASAIAVSGPITRVTNQPGIFNVVVSDSPVSPNADGIRDEMRIAADVTRQADWTVTIKDRDNTVVHEVTGNTAIIDEAFTVFPLDGDYSFELEAEAATGLTATPISGTFRVDATFPTAQITSPTTEGGVIPTVSGTVPIEGTADDANFDSLVVEVDPDGAGPEERVEVHTDNMPFLQRVIHVLNTTQFDNTPGSNAVIYLTVTDKAGNVSTTTQAIEIANPVPDLTKPTVTLAATHDSQPVAGDTAPIGGLIDLQLDATDNQNLAGVDILLDGSVIASQTNIAAGSTTLNHQVNTAFIADGQHSLVARATDESGNAEETALSFRTAGEVSNFQVNPTALTPSTGSTLTITAALQASAGWTLSFTGPTAITDITGTGNTISEQLDASALSLADGAYTVTLNVPGVTDQPGFPGGAPSIDFIIDLVMTPPTVAITNLNDVTELEDQVPVIREGLFTLTGTADDSDVTDDVRYKIELINPSTFAVVRNVTPAPGSGPNPDLDAEGFAVARVNSATGNSFGELDFTLVRNGSYDLRVTVESGGQSVSATRRFTLNSQLKVGQFGFSQQDLVIPVTGLSLPVIRTYNSIKAAANETSDFGFGWTYSIADVELQHDEERVTVTDINNNPFSMRTGDIFKGRNVTLTLPDGERTTFRFGLRQVDRFGFEYEAFFTPTNGVYDRLEPIGRKKFIFLFGLQYWEATGVQTSPERFDFPGYTLTTKDGTKYEILRENLGDHFVDFGASGQPFIQAYGRAYLNSITDRNGNKVQFTRDGDPTTTSGGGALERLDHFNASGTLTRSLVFEKDGQGRIIAIHDPNHLDETGNIVPGANAAFTYQYDASGNLQFVNQLTDETDPQNPTYLTTEYKYENPSFPHYITDIVDARGVTPLKSIYDDDGRLIATEDADGNQIQLSRDITARTETVFDREGNPTIHTYDKRGNVTSTTNALGHTTTITYDNDDNELTVTDPLGNAITRTYDGQGNITSVTDSAGNTTRVEYDSFGNQTKIIDPAGNTVTADYDASGNEISLIDPMGHKLTAEYDPSGNRTAKYDPRGNKLDITTYSSEGRPVKIDFGDGIERNFSYDSNLRMTGTSFDWINPNDPVDVQNITSTYQYDSSGQMLRYEDSYGVQNNIKYNLAGQVQEMSSSESVVASITYDVRGNQINVVYSDGTSSQAVYDRNGRQIAVADRHPDGIAGPGSRTIYDSAGRIVRGERLDQITITVVSSTIPGQYESSVESVGNVISAVEHQHDAAGRMVQLTGNGGFTTRYQYGANGQIASVTDAFGNETEYEYGNTGQLSKTTDSLGRITQYQYDARGQMTKVIKPDGTAVSVLYDEMGREKARSDELGQQTQTFYDNLGRMVGVALPEIIDPSTGESTTPAYTYNRDAYGRINEYVDPLDRTTLFSFNERGVETRRVLPLGQEKKSFYDDKNRLIKQINYNGIINTVEYDDANNIVHQKWFDAGADIESDTPISYRNTEIDSNGRIFRVEAADASMTEYLYDDEGRVIQVSSPEGSVIYEYLFSSPLPSKVTTSNNTFEYEYDEGGRLKTIALREWLGNELAVPLYFTFDYDSSGFPAAMTRPNGTRTEWGYDLTGKVEEIRDVNGAGSLLSTLAYSYRSDGMRSEVIETSFENGVPTSAIRKQYEYDSLSRLTGEVVSVVGGESVRSESYGYDLAGNRVRAEKSGNNDGVVTYTYDDNDRLIQEDFSGASGVNTRSFEYDANGALIRELSVGIDEYEKLCEYSPEDRLSKVTVIYTDGGVLVRREVTFTYNHLGDRVRKQVKSFADDVLVDELSKFFLFDSHNLTGYSQVIETASQAGGAAEESYVIGRKLLAKGTSSGPVVYLHADVLGTTQFVTDDSGNTIQSYEYDAFGDLIEGDGGAIVPAVDHLFTGEYLDLDIGYYNLRARHLDTSIGRFTRVDPFDGHADRPQSIHNYTYVENDPVNRIDPSGMLSLKEVMVGITIGSIIGLTVAGVINRLIYGPVALNSPEPSGRWYGAYFNLEGGAFVVNGQIQKEVVMGESSGTVLFLNTITGALHIIESLLLVGSAAWPTLVAGGSGIAVYVVIDMLLWLIGQMRGKSFSKTIPTLGALLTAAAIWLLLTPISLFSIANAAKGVTWARGAGFDAAILAGAIAYFGANKAANITNFAFGGEASGGRGFEIEGAIAFGTNNVSAWETDGFFSDSFGVLAGFGASIGAGGAIPGSLLLTVDLTASESMERFGLDFYE